MPKPHPFWLTFYCPFQDETGREPDNREPCPRRYMLTCGCHKDSTPAPRKRWTRAA